MAPIYYKEKTKNGNELPLTFVPQTTLQHFFNDILSINVLYLHLYFPKYGVTYIRGN